MDSELSVHERAYTIKKRHQRGRRSIWSTSSARGVISDPTTAARCGVMTRPIGHENAKMPWGKSMSKKREKNRQHTTRYTEKYPPSYSYHMYMGVISYDTPAEAARRIQNCIRTTMSARQTANDAHGGQYQLWYRQISIATTSTYIKKTHTCRATSVTWLKCSSSVMNGTPRLCAVIIDNKLNGKSGAKAASVSQLNTQISGEDNALSVPYPWTSVRWLSGFATGLEICRCFLKP